jgi:gliding motility-associated-like protein
MKATFIIKSILIVVALAFATGLSAQTTCTEIVVPNIITPNNDGFNDKLVIECIENFPDNELTIYSRWGEIVYHAFGYSNNWDGFAETNKSELPAGTYVYILKATVNNEQKTINGSITIVR